MSEQLELANNLCTTVDAFEKFQALNMYEENEYIVLSDVLPEKRSNQDKCMEANNKLVREHESDIVLSNTDCDQYVNTSGRRTDEFVTKKKALEFPRKDSETSNINSEAAESNEDNINDKEHNDKLKSSIPQGFQTEDYKNEQSETIQDIENFLKSTDASTSVKKKGKKPKLKNKAGQKLVEPKKNSEMNVSSILELPITNTKLTDLVSSDAKKICKRRGRPKKHSAEKNELSNNQSTDDIDNIISSELDSTKLNISNETTTDKTYSSIPLKLRIRKILNKSDICTTTHTDVDKNLTVTNTLEFKEIKKNCDIKRKTVHSKHRERKSSSKEIDKQSQSQVSADNIESIDFDNEDDVCLSKLSKNDNDSLDLILDIDSTSKQISANTASNRIIENKQFNIPIVSKINEKLSENNSQHKSLNLSITVSGSEDEISRNNSSDNVIHVEDEGDDICLSKLKETTETLNENKFHENIETPQKRNSKKTIMSDFEYNIDSIVSGCHDKLHTSDKISQLEEEGSKRSVRRKTKQPLHYDEGSDEDPFANVELSDNETFKSKKSRYYSDDEYIPRENKRQNTCTDSSDSETNVIDNETKKFKRRKSIRKSETTSPKKRGKKCNAEKFVETDVQQNDDIEEYLDPSCIRTKDESNSRSNTWGSSNEFENFLAMRIQGTNLKIKKVSSKENAESVITPLQIPTIDPNEARKTSEMSSQTNIVTTSVAAVQTNTKHDIPLKENIPLTSEQSKSACEFLKSVVKTTAELGQLMTQKSDDFIKKKINTEHVTDTFKMDYCVKKTYLLLNLAKHNLTQMEDDLAKQYELFLQENKLTHCREEPIQLLPTVKDNDSDCEIVEELATPTKSHKRADSLPKFNPKTVFLNKELSIKIAKKPNEEKKLNIKGKHTVWLNDAVMVKKIKSTQSFLAQDSRNKKPPDYNQYVTLKMVSDFFDKYNYHKMLTTCAQFTSREWFTLNKDCICNYFVIKPDINGCDKQNITVLQDFSVHSTVHTEVISNTNSKVNTVKNAVIETKISNPQTLVTLCIQTLRSHICVQRSDVIDNNDLSTCQLADGKITREPKTLMQLSLKVLSNTNLLMDKRETIKNVDLNTCSAVLPPSLVQLCYKKIKMLFFETDFSSEPLNHYNFDTCSSVLPPSLIQLCYKKIKMLFFETDFSSEPLNHYNFDTCSTVLPPSLKQLCYKKIKMLVFETDFSSGLLNHYNFDDKFVCKNDVKETNDNCNIENLSVVSFEMQNDIIEIESLFTICINYIQKNLLSQDNIFSPIDCNFHRCRKFSPKSLKYISYKNIIHLLNVNNSQMQDKQEISSCAKNVAMFTNEDNEELSEIFNINSINTLSEEAFLNLHTTSLDIQGNHEDLENYEDDNSMFNNDEFENIVHHADNNLSEGTSWVTQVEMKELKSGITLSIQNSDNSQESAEVEKETPIQIKLEQIEEISSNIVDVSIVKTEHMPGLDEMTIIPENVVIKSELPDCSIPNDDCILSCNSSSYDATVFENFLRSNKLITSQNMYEDDEVFSQSILRVSGIHEPDYDSELDSFDSLLIPQTYKTLHVENAKNCLMESNSEDDNSNTKIGKKKADKRKLKRKTVKVSNKNTLPLIKELDKSQNNNELTTVTTRMRDKIRQKEKELASSDSEAENDLNINIKKTEDYNKCKSKSDTINNEIQCNNVDSTQKIAENPRSATNDEEISKNDNVSDQTKTELSHNSKHLIDKVSTNNITNETRNERIEKNVINTYKESHSSFVTYDGPVEVLECEPTMPIFDDCIYSKSDNNSPINIDGSKSKSLSEVQDSMNNDNNHIEFTDHNGWKCYKIDCNDSKLVQNVKIILEKLPETFVETYIQYQDIMNSHNQEDLEIERLTNLNSLKRSTRENRSNIKNRKVITEQEKLESVSSQPNNQTLNNGESENFDELTPSEDEDTEIDVRSVSPLPVKAPENNMAKDSLMNDNDSDDGININKIKEEPSEEITRPKRHPGPKSKMSLEVIENTELMLTADKVMNKELTLLNGPVLFDSSAYVSNKDSTNNKKQKIPVAKTYLTRERIKIEKEEEDYSSEEEKRWFNTKEKLLRSMDKRSNASVSDAKHAKLVSEFIEKRSDKTRKRKAFKCRRSRKKLMEQQKQLSVLYKELYGETLESVTGAEGYGQRYIKGQRSNGKVVGKKYQKSKTELAYPILFEESERTKRLHARQAQLRELLGCEENETVQVIEDKVCLEYDFETKKPVVSVHGFFTEVMKEHQYAGVKFMWDACFESLADIERGHLGSGCILAHCMGLGKTLQVLALLHTVMTHPRVGMRRVLVCCPLSTVLNWVDEIHKWIGPVTNEIKVFELSKLKKTYERAYQLEDWFKGGGIFIIGYELFRSLTTLDPLLDDVRPNVINKIRSALLDPGPDIIVCDEGHLLKNDCSVLTIAMSRVATKRRIVLTGTPMQNNLREYYCMVNFIKPNLLGTYAEFYKRFESPIINGQHRDSTEEDTKLMNSCTYILHKVLEGCLQRHEVSVMYPYLPKKHEYTVFVTLTKYQWDMYKHYMYNYAKEANQNVLKDFHILQKIWSHPQVLHNFQTKSLMNKAKMKLEKLEDDLAQEDLAADMKPPHAESWWLQYLDEGKMLDFIESSNKFLAVFRILEECVEIENKVLIFSTSLFTLDSLEYFLKKMNNWSLGQEYFRLDGSVPAEVRQKWCREFNAEDNHKTKLFLISTRAGCLGLNLTAANRVIILDTSWNPAHDIQSIFRVYRFGQKRDCFIYRLVAMGTMEQKIYERSVTKQAVACRVLDEQLIDRHYNSADLNELYLYDETGMTVPGGVSMGVADAVILRVARDAPIHAVHEHDSLLRGTSEQGLLEHERVDAWKKFQQEHARKQMENKIATTKAQRQLKNSKGTENTALDYLEVLQKEDTKDEAKLNPKPSPIPVVNRGRKAVVTNCCIPIKKDEEPSTSKEPVITIKDKVLEDIMVKKITTILVKHNYNKKDEEKITELVAKVRNIIACGNDSMAGNDNDELSKSIADIMLQKEMSILTDIITASINNTLNVTTSDVDNAVRKRKCETTVDESVVKFNDINESFIETDNGKRKKRKTALAAEKSLKINIREESKMHLESIENDDVKRRTRRRVSLSENSCTLNLKTENTRNICSNNDVKPNKVIEKKSTTNEKEINKNQVNLENGNKKKTRALIEDVKLVFNSQNNNLNNNVQSIITNNEGRRKSRRILSERSHDPEPKKQLIDLTEPSENKQGSRKKRKSAPIDETQTGDVIDLTEKPDGDFKNVAKKSKSVNPKNHKEINQQKQCDVNESRITLQANNGKNPNEKIKEPENEVVPLHSSILKNDNFVKIVAHKYLKDNPTMTQEVAVLAARHKINSTLEACEAGNIIYSGDIYDKAVEILGIEMLKELHKMGAEKVSTPVKKPTATLEVEHVRPEGSPKNNIKKPSETNDYKRAKSNEEKQDTSQGSFTVYQMRPKSGVNAAPPAVRPPQLNCDVVPVGLFKGPANLQAPENFQRDVNCSFQILDEDECILPDDDSIAAPPPLQIISQKHPETAPSVSSTKARSQIVTATATPTTTAPTRRATTMPFKVTSGPQEPAAATPAFTEVTMRTHTHTNKRTVKPTLTQYPKVGKESAPAADRDVVVILSDDEEAPTPAVPIICPPVVRPADGGPIPVALTKSGITHSLPPKLTYITEHNSPTKMQSIQKLSLVKLNNDAAENTVTIQVNDEIQEVPVSAVRSSGTRTQPISKMTKVPLILKKIITTTRPQSHKNIDTNKTVQEKRTEANSSQCVTSQSVTTPRLLNPVQSSIESVFHNVVHIEATEYFQNLNAADEVPKLKAIPVIRKVIDTSSTTDGKAENTKQRCQIIKLMKTSEAPNKLQLSNSSSKTYKPESNSQIVNTTKTYKSQNKSQIVNTTKVYKPQSKSNITKTTKPQSKTKITHNMIIDLTEESSTSSQAVQSNSSSKLAISKTYNVCKKTKVVNEEYDKLFKKLVTKKKDSDRSAGVNESVKK